MASVFVALLTAGSASAATPQQIYRDLADNGVLDRTYTRADWERAFGSKSSLPSYLRRPQAPVRTPQAVVPSTPPLTAEGGGRSLPFTGLDAALFAVVGGPLLLLGAGMRRAARQQPAGEAT